MRQSAFNSLNLHLRRGCALLGGIALVFPVLPARAERSYSEYRARTRDYQVCVFQLREVGIAEADAASACAAALAPRTISECVTAISAGTALTPTDALAGCRQVRRPTDLATCVVDISAVTGGALPADTLNACRRSLLPLRFSNCVIGAGVETTLQPAALFDVCLAAGDRPRNVLPSFVPASQGIPTTPGTSITPRLTPLVPMQ